jgi:site-specific recombinase XerD
MSSKLQHEAKQLVGKNYGKASLTTEKLVQNIERIAEFMETQGLQSIRHLKTKHVERFFSSISNLSPSTRANYATAMRQIASAIGKKNIMPRANAEIGIDRSDRYSPKHGNIEKMLEIRNTLYENGEWRALAFDVQRQFGLRIKESLLSNKTQKIDGKEFLVVEGAKGGRPRNLEIRTPEQAAVVERVQEYIRQSGSSSLIPKEKTLSQGYKSLVNAISRAGGTKENQANSHLWRHEKAREMSDSGSSDKDIAEHLGHGRESVVRHYK